MCRLVWRMIDRKWDLPNHLHHLLWPFHHDHLPDEITETTDPDALRQHGSSEYWSGNRQRVLGPVHLLKPAYDQTAEKSSTPPKSEDPRTFQKSDVLLQFEPRTFWSIDMKLRNDLFDCRAPNTTFVYLDPIKSNLVIKQSKIIW